MDPQRVTIPAIDDRIEMERLGVVMSPEPGMLDEAEGVLNPATARDQNGDLWLFARKVARGNRSRIGRALVIESAGRPAGVDRRDDVLAPDLWWEQNPRTAGVEDPRITLIAELDCWVMTYAAYGPFGPRIAIATSTDLIEWTRHGLVDFAYEPGWGTDFTLYRNKDALLFPEVVAAPDGRAALGMLHRPMWDLDEVIPGAGSPLPQGIEDHRLSIWVSFLPLDELAATGGRLRSWSQHRPVAFPEHDWEALKIGGGAPPVRVDDGWLLIHHGVRGVWQPGVDQQQDVFYSAGALLLDPSDVTNVIGRTRVPLLAPETPAEREGIVPNVVFPTAIERVPGQENLFDLYYGMADTRIGAARLRWAGSREDRSLPTL